MSVESRVVDEPCESVSPYSTKVVDASFVVHEIFAPGGKVIEELMFEITGVAVSIVTDEELVVAITCVAELPAISEKSIAKEASHCVSVAVRI